MSGDLAVSGAIFLFFPAAENCDKSLAADDDDDAGLV